MGGFCSCFETTTIILPQRKQYKDDDGKKNEGVPDPPVFPTSDFLCTICIDETNLNEIEFIPCGHAYHKDCLRAWWRKNFTCPVCNLNVRELVSSSKELLLDDI